MTVVENPNTFYAEGPLLDRGPFGQIKVQVEARSKLKPRSGTECEVQGKSALESRRQRNRGHS